MGLEDKVEYTVNYVWDRSVPVDIDKILAHYNFVVNYIPNKLAIKKDNGIIKEKGNYMVEISYGLNRLRKINVNANPTDDTIRNKKLINIALAYMLIEYFKAGEDYIRKFIRRYPKARDYVEYTLNEFWFSEVNLIKQKGCIFEAYSKLALKILMPETAVDYVINKKNITSLKELSDLFLVEEHLVKLRLKSLGWL